MDTPTDLMKYLQECVEIAPDFLDEEFIRLPADVAFWGQKFAEAARDRDYAALLVKQVRARAEHRIRGEAIAATEKVLPPVAEGEVSAKDQKAAKATAKAIAPKLTEAGVAAAVSLDPEVMSAEQAEANADYEVNRVKGILDAVRTKRDMVVQLGATKRLEMESDPIIRARMAARRNLQNDS